jgi:hypothetical protein
VPPLLLRAKKWFVTISNMTKSIPAQANNTAITADRSTSFTREAKCRGLQGVHCVDNDVQRRKAVLFLSTRVVPG